jgi:hypothetical protein
MATLVRRWETSGEPRGAFARRHGLTVSQFDYWKRLVRQQASHRDETPAGFTRVDIIEGAVGSIATGIDVAFRGGERLTMHPGTAPELVRAVVLALRTSC